MKFIVDENETDLFLPPLRVLYPDHDWLHINDYGLAGSDDVELFQAISELGVTALITRDVAQLRRADEFATLDRLGIHWIGHKEPKESGLAGISTLVSNYSAAMPHILDALPSLRAPTAISVKGRSNNLESCIRAHELGSRQLLKLGHLGAE